MNTLSVVVLQSPNAGAQMMAEAADIFPGGFSVAASGYPHGVTNADRSITVRRSTRDCRDDEVMFLVDYSNRFFSIRGTLTRDSSTKAIEIEVKTNEFSSHALRRPYSPLDPEVLELFGSIALAMSACIASAPSESLLRGKKPSVATVLRDVDGNVVSRV